VQEEIPYHIKTRPQSLEMQSMQSLGSTEAAKLKNFLFDSGKVMLAMWWLCYVCVVEKVFFAPHVHCL
jgi:hypothetical protein